MSSVREILRNKPAATWAISPKSTAFEALELMSEKNIGAVLVLDDKKIVGIFSERDYARKVTLFGKSSRETAVEEIMTKKVYYARPDQSVEECMALMTDKYIRHLPVLENDKLVGIISIGDVVKTIISDQKFTIKELEKYITGSAAPTF